MAILWCDSFNSYGSTSDLSKAYGSNTDNTLITLNLTGGPSSDPCAQFVKSGNANVPMLLGALYAPPASTILGGRFKFKQSALAFSSYSLMSISTKSSTNITEYWHMGTTNTGLVWVTLAGQILQTSGSASQTAVTNVCDNAWHVIEWQTDLKDSGGVFKVWIDGVLEINFSGDTYGGTAHATTPWGASSTAFAFLSALLSNTTATRSIKDVVFFDSAGVSGNLRTADQPFGNIVIATLRPSGAGTTTQFTPSAGSNYQCVDEVAQNDGTDYVEATTSGFRDLYAMGNLGLSPTTVYGVVAKVFAQNPGGLTISMKQTLKSGATTVANTATVANLIGDYKEQVYDLNPDGSVVWTGATVDAVEQGFEVA